jgi:hypothetical protein
MTFFKKSCVLRNFLKNLFLKHLSTNQAVFKANQHYMIYLMLDKLLKHVI